VLRGTKVVTLEPEQWSALLEGDAQTKADSGHWVNVYVELIRSLERIAIETPAVSTYTEHMRRRLAYWKGQLYNG
jgi:hypothetical protein